MGATTTLKMVLLGEDKSAGKTLNQVGDSAEKSTHKLSGLGSSVKNVLTGFLAFEAGRKAVEFLKDAGERAIEDEKSTKLLAQQLHNNAGATREQIAATEDWITAQGKAYGVTDDDLRPALGRLVAATHSVTKARKLAALGENISAGTGKSLTAVTTALARAQNGSVSSLSRLGIKTKDAAGHTISLHQATKQLAQTYRGDAAKAANTTAGQWARLKVMLDETEEAIGYKLIPIATKLATWLLTKAVPAAESFAGSLKKNLAPVIDKVKDGIAKLQPVAEKIGQFLKNNPGTVKVFVGVLGGLALALGVVTGAMTALDLVMAANPFVLAAVAIAGLAAGIYYAYKHSEKFRAIVQKIGEVLKGMGKAIEWVIGFIKQHWKLIGTILLGPIVPVVAFIVKHFGQITDAVGDVIGWVKQHWKLILGFLTGPIGAAAIVIASHWSDIKQGAADVVDWIRGIPGKIGQIAGRFGDAGKALIQAFVNGMKNAAGIISGIAGNVWDAVKKLLNGAIARLNGALDFTISLPGPDLHINAGKIPYLAAGGIVSRPTVAMIGEAGPEAVVPLSAGALARHGLSGGGGDVNVTVNLRAPNGRLMQQELLRFKRDNGGKLLGIG